MTTQSIIIPNAPPLPWTDEDVARLLAMKAANKPTSEIVAAFPGRTLGAIAVKWSKVTPRGEGGRPSFKAPESKFFTDEEKRKIHELRRTGMSYNKIQREHFPSRSVQGIRKAHNSAMWLRTSRKFRKTKWTLEEEQKLLHLRLNQKLDIRSAAAELGRSYNSVVDRWKDIGPKGTSYKTPQAIRCDSFTPEEDHKLLDMYHADKFVSEIYAQFPQHSHRRVYNRIMYLLRRGDRERILRRKPHEIRQQVMSKLQELVAQGMSSQEMAAQFPDIPEKTLQTYFYKLDEEHRKAAAKRTFSAADDEVVSRMAKEAASLSAIRSALNDRFSVWHIKNRILHLGLRDEWRGGPDGLYRLFTPEDDQMIIELSKEGATRDAIRAKLDNRYSLFQLRRRIRILEERESFKAKKPVHWEVRKRADSLADSRNSHARIRLQPGTKEADETVMSMAHAGKSDRDILDVVGYPSIKTMRMRLRELGAQYNVNIDRRYKSSDPKFTPEDDNLICDMYASGATLAEINTALKWQFGYRKVESHIRYLTRLRGIRRPPEYNLSQKRERFGPASITPADETLIGMYKDDATNHEIMQALGLTTTYQLRAWLKDLRERKGVQLSRRAKLVTMTAEQFEKRQKQREAERRSRARRRDPAKPPIKHHAVFTPEDDEKLIALAREGAGYAQMVAAFDSKFSPYKIRRRRALLGYPDVSGRGYSRGPRKAGTSAPRKAGASTAPRWKLDEDTKARLAAMRDLGLGWPEMAAQLPGVPVEVAQDYYFYGKQVIKLRADGTPRRARTVRIGSDGVGIASSASDEGAAEPDTLGTAAGESEEHDGGEDEDEQTDQDDDALAAEEGETQEPTSEEEEFEETQDAWEDEHGEDEDEERYQGEADGDAESWEYEDEEPS